MTEPSPARPIPGPPRPGPAVAGSTAEDRRGAPSFEPLAQLPVAEHVDVFEREHARLRCELGTIDQL